MSNLKRTLGPISGAALMLNIVVGAGLLTLPGLAAKAAGPMAIYSWLLCALAAIPLLLVFIIMGRRYPNAGGIAHFAEAAFGRFGYLAASFLFLGAVFFGLPAIAMTGGHYLASVIAVDPAIIALALIVIAAGTQITAPETASKIATAIASLIIIALLITLIIGYAGTPIEAFQTSFPMPKLANFDIILAPVLMIFFAFTGWEVAAGISEEFKNPKRDFPIAMILSFIAATLLYLGMAVLVQVSPHATNSEAAFANIIGAVSGKIGSLSVVLIAALIILANLMGAIWAVSRMIYSLSRENVLPLKLEVDDKGRPMGAVILLVSILSAVILMDYFNLLALETMLHIAGQNFLLLFGVSAIALFTLTKEKTIRFVALLAAAIVILLIFAIGQFVAYPIGLVLLAALVWRLDKKKPIAV
ncbi:APC family permease [Ahrensia sp. 13_GOM-1096m]|uniref:APC family permease n=1 Tax=Ahrensia sp. 13_GOM-1096m TaxID=1380380 RepID=UPI00047BC03B|nr:amino acid permease [Ahrensia sp. 13_GOM-1096m]